MTEHAKDSILRYRRRADQGVINRINLLDDDGVGQKMLSVIGKERTIFLLGEKTGSVLWADIEEHSLTNSPKAYGLNQVFQVFGHSRLDGTKKDMIASDHLAMVDSQKCLMIDERNNSKIIALMDDEKQ